MDHKQYIERALATESRPARINLGPITLHMALNYMVAAGDAMDQIKRGLFYGPEKMDKDKLMQALAGTSTLSELLAGMVHNGVHFDDDDVKVFQPESVDPKAKNLDRSRVNLRLLHAAIGHFTESSEKIRALLAQYETGELDVVNYAEEMGDSNEWYSAIEYDELGLDQTTVRQANLDKLAKRNKGAAFNAEATTTGRDVATEREVLEASLANA
ncbi:hypothetical protein [Cupriavidus campinensis]|uniref:Uncharacterized protein n=1 Tax=Cupriavidus campinensis TaxID=151783 RepID=A0ABY3ESS9_9BURK|nr:hypothetical protein [Cupriavidus campinensis]TSP14016.1 hypothetical protein FGG12_05975 [Cupriavidus campinensis]